MSSKIQIICGDALKQLKRLPDESVQCCITGPPQWYMFDYGVEGQYGMEETVDEYIAKLVEVFWEVARVLNRDGCCWIQIGDSYSGGRGNLNNRKGDNIHTGQAAITKANGYKPGIHKRAIGFRNKELLGIPWRLALALHSSPLILRADIIWRKTAPIPEKTFDRTTREHEYIFLLSKKPNYYWDHISMREGGHNCRSIWKIEPDRPTLGYPYSCPVGLPIRCIKAGSKPGDTILDPFAGSCTTGSAARMMGRDFIGIELNPEWCELGELRLEQEEDSEGKVSRAEVDWAIRNLGRSK